MRRIYYLYLKRIIVSFFTLVFFSIFVVFARGDTNILSAPEYLVREYRFSKVSWEIENFLSKWLYKVETVMPWSKYTPTYGYSALQRYLDISKDIQDATANYESLPQDMLQERMALQDYIETLYTDQDALRPPAEEFLESEISRTLRTEGFGIGNFLWPPTDFRLDTERFILVISQRDQIKIDQTVILNNNIYLHDIEDIEDKLLRDSNLSAVVLRIGGFATYPAMITINANSNILNVIEVSSHEWLHNYLFFHPLGSNYYSGGGMAEINEVLAQTFEKEIGSITYNRITDSNIPTLVPPIEVVDPDHIKAGEQWRFDFVNFMRETRRETDRLLANGQIDEAEEYMENRRILLAQEQNISIRKINQAYFAFMGNYASSGGSVSSVPADIWNVRTAKDSIKDTVEFLKDVSNKNEFEELTSQIQVNP